MPHITGRKITNSHTTIIDAALPLVQALHKLPFVSKIILDVITPIKNSRSTKSVKIAYEQAGLLLKVRGNTSIQEVRIYTSDKLATEAAILQEG